jgi:GTP-binding protein HflX
VISTGKISYNPNGDCNKSKDDGYSSQENRRKQTPYTVEQRDRALLVVIDPSEPAIADWNTEELKELLSSAGADLADEVHLKRSRPDPVYYIGQGNAFMVYEMVQDTEASVVVVGEDLSPTQQRNLEDTATVRVVDRTQLILDIFAQRAHTKEGKLQVELAQLNYLLPRLTGRGTAMSRLGGGIGTRGPGETKLESDRRRLRARISDLTEELDEVRQHRGIQKAGRRRLPFPSAALVGYTSAGKSTLLNVLSGSDVYVHEKLFATLDPTTRRIELPDGWSVLLSDTVGFLRDLPHHLVAAFRATMEEVIEADFLIHVVDAHHLHSADQQKAVMQVLEELGGAVNKPIITVFNKADLIADQYELRHAVVNTPNSVYISAKKREGLQYLTRQMSKTIQSLLTHVRLELPYGRSDILSLCYDRGRVISTDYQGDKIIVEAEITKDLVGKLESYIKHSPASDKD